MRVYESHYSLVPRAGCLGVRLTDTPTVEEFTIGSLQHKFDSVKFVVEVQNEVFFNVI